MNIIYTGLFAYPDSSANTLRVQGVVKLLKELGHDIKILPGLISNYDQNLWTDESIEVVSTKEYQTGIFSSVSGIRGLFVGDNTLNYLEKMSVKPDIIILYGTHLGYLTRLLNFTRKHNIKLILDVVEWYDPRHLPGGIFGPYAIMNELSMRFFVKKADGLIVISEYLRKYYEVSNKNIFLLPPLFPQSDNINFNKYKSKVLNLCYVGTPGKKENFEILNEALELLYKDNIKFYMHYVGFDKNFIKNKKYSFINDKSVCKFHGRLENSESKLIVSNSHYTIFFRPNLRFSNAGFPSKVAESFSLGTSIISNDFSDLKKYIVNGENGYILKGEITSENIYKLIKKLAINVSSYNVIQNNALKTYCKYFDLKSYPNFKIFINELSLSERIK
ncbi:glycosyltransferase [Acinetobacter towneri]|uniref:glycosyltransferase n=1 Tax=Acinetobacter towneri TaxID=202956 RepID=UPI0025754BD4|nr:glycosyltransferase [Acinetobacter towneri]MDM1487159.1 glycosyltransferase [Acinetobacter towneri]